MRAPPIALVFCNLRRVCSLHARDANMAISVSQIARQRVPRHRDRSRTRFRGETRLAKQRVARGRAATQSVARPALRAFRAVQQIRPTRIRFCARSLPCLTARLGAVESRRRAQSASRAQFFDRDRGHFARAPVGHLFEAEPRDAFLASIGRLLEFGLRLGLDIQTSCHRASSLDSRR